MIMGVLGNMMGVIKSKLIGIIFFGDDVGFGKMIVIVDVVEDMRFG